MMAAFVVSLSSMVCFLKMMFVMCVVVLSFFCFPCSSAGLALEEDNDSGSSSTSSSLRETTVVVTVNAHGHHPSLVNDPKVLQARDVNSGGVVGPTRRLITAELAHLALTQNVPGDFVETGVFNGGTSAIMLKTLQQYDTEGSRKFYACDSFEGLPDPVEQDKVERHLNVDGKDVNSKQSGVGLKGKWACDVTCVEDTFKKAGVWDENRIIFVKGWFNESLPHIAVDKIAFLRLDGDLYESTRDALKYLYHKLSPCGYIYIDDYGSFAGCAKAVDDYREAHGITAKMHAVTEVWKPTNGEADSPMDPTQDRFEALWWQKPCSEGEGAGAGATETESRHAHRHRVFGDDAHRFIPSSSRRHRRHSDSTHEKISV